MNTSSAAAAGVLVVGALGIAAWYFLTPAADSDAFTSGGSADDNTDSSEDVVSMESVPADQNAVRPIRDNNWGDLLYNAANQWKGQTGSAGGYCVFDTPENGLRAAFLNLHSYFNRGLNTINAIVTQWAPPPGNPTAQYISTVAGWMGVNPQQPLTWRDDNTVPLMMSICQFEIGFQPGTEEFYQAALEATGY